MKKNKFYGVFNLKSPLTPLCQRGAWGDFTISSFLILTCALILCLTGCGGIPSGNFQSALQSQPYVVDLAPNPYQFYDRLTRIEVTFSKPIDADSITDRSVFVVKGALDPEQYADPENVEDDLEGGQLQIVEGTAAQGEADPQKISWAPSQPLTGGEYSLVITPDLKGEDRIPFNQQPGENPTNFIAVYRMEGDDGVSPSDSVDNPSSPSILPKIRPAFLVINEALYDAIGSDTDGNEFIELYGEPNTDLSVYQVVLVNGADGAILETINIPDGAQIAPDGIFLIADTRTSATTSNIVGADLLDNFDPQNGPDALQVLDDQGRLMDALAYGNGNVPAAHNGLAAGEGNPAVDVAAGHSLSRIQGQDTHDNAADFVDLSVPTPGVL